jgi:hypothetical protein
MKKFVSALNTGMSQYLETELANAQLGLMGAVNAPVQALLGHLPIRAAAASDARAAAAGAAVTTPPVRPVGPVKTPITENIPVFHEHPTRGRWP